MEIWEDNIGDNIERDDLNGESVGGEGSMEDAARDESEEMATVVQDDIDQPSDNGPLQPIPSINLLGIDYGDNEDDMDDDFAVDENGLRLSLVKDHADIEGGETLLPPKPTAELSPNPDDGDPAGNQVTPLAEAASPEIIADKAPKLDEPVDDFHLAIMLFITAADLSTSQYEALVEVLALATTENIQTLPKSIRTLKDRCRKSFPLLDIKARPVDVSLNVTPPKTENPRWAYYFNSADYCRLWLSNPKLNPLIYKGLGQIVDVPTELWHGDAWMESVRSTSGKFARIQEIGPSGAREAVVLLLSDCVRFIDSSEIIALGRVKAVGIDNRSVRPEGGLYTS